MPTREKKPIGRTEADAINDLINQAEDAIHAARKAMTAAGCSALTAERIKLGELADALRRIDARECVADVPESKGGQR